MSGRWPQFRPAATIDEPPGAGAWNVEGVLRPALVLVIGGTKGVVTTHLLREFAIPGATGSGRLFGHVRIPASAVDAFAESNTSTCSPSAA
jgi:hypothetical protein